MPRSVAAHSHAPIAVGAARFVNRLRSGARILGCTSLVLGMAALARPTAGATMAQVNEVDQAVIATLTSWGVSQAVIISHIDLTKPFEAVSQWTLVIAQDTGPPPAQVADSNAHGPITICLVRAAAPDCSETLYADVNGEDRSFTTPFSLLDGRVVHAGRVETRPLLLLKTCSAHSLNGSCGIATALYAYDRSADRFYRAFLNFIGSNNNQASRFVESGPLRGDVMVDYPTENAPYTYWVEVYRPEASQRYVRVLRHRGYTRYGDRNPLAVADSEMPEILRHMGLWRPGDPLPAPDGCSHPVLRHSEEWCE